MDHYMNSDAALGQFFNQVVDYGLVFLDAQGYVVRANEGARFLKGYTCTEMVGMHFSIFYTPEATALGHPERELALAEAVGRYEEEGWRVRKDGSRYWAHIIITAIFDEHKVLQGFAKILRDFTQQKQADEQAANVMKLLDLTARTDYLTGLDNRRSFDKKLNYAILMAQREKRPLSLAMIDLDHFKDYNDTLGHSVGDSYLKLATTAWRKALRPQDSIGRYGGEEFIVVLCNVALEEAIACMDRVRLATPTPLTCSIGIAQWRKSETANLLIDRADHALYLAKRTGRNRLAFDPDPANGGQPDQGCTPCDGCPTHTRPLHIE